MAEVQTTTVNLQYNSVEYNADGSMTHRLESPSGYYPLIGIYNFIHDYRVLDEDGNKETTKDRYFWKNGYPLRNPKKPKMATMRSALNDLVDRNWIAPSVFEEKMQAFAKSDGNSSNIFGYRVYLEGHDWIRVKDKGVEYFIEDNRGSSDDPGMIGMTVDCKKPPSLFQSACDAVEAKVAKDTAEEN